MPAAVIFCESYGQIRYTLQLIQRYHAHHDVTLVIPGFHDLLELMQGINKAVFQNKLHIFHIEPYKIKRASRTGIGKIIHVIPDISGEKRYLDDFFALHLAQLKEAEVFFFSRGFIGTTSFFLKKLNKNNNITYVDLASLGPPYAVQAFPCHLAELANLIIWKMTYGGQATLGKLPYYRGFIFTTDGFMRRNVHRVIGHAEIIEMMKTFTLEPYRVFNTENFDVIYFDDAVGEAGYISDIARFKAELAGIFEIIKKYFPENKIAYKYHPGYAGDGTLITTGTKLPTYIPAELLYGEQTKLYISIFSRSIANAGNGTVVSIAKLVTFKSDAIKNKLIEELTGVSKSKVLFPESLDEFEQIVAKLK